MHDITVSPIMGTLSNWLLIILRWYPIIWSPNCLFLINQNVQSLHTTIVGVCKFKVGDSLPKNNKNNYCSTLFSIASVVWSTQKSYLSKCKDTVLKYYLSKRESHSYEKYLSESPKVYHIKLSVVQVKMNYTHIYMYVYYGLIDYRPGQLSDSILEHFSDFWNWCYFFMWVKKAS